MKTKMAILKDWKYLKVNLIAPLQRGYDLPVSKIQMGEYPVVFSNGPLKLHNEFKVKGPGVVTGRSGTIGKVHFIVRDYWPHNTALWVTDFKGNHPKFIYYFYKNLKLGKFGSGSGVPTLNRNDVHAYTASIPPLPEQEKIVEVLETWDSYLEKLSEVINLKKIIKSGLRSSLLRGKVRLVDFNEPWKTKEIGELLEYEQPTNYIVQSTAYSDVYDTPVLTAGKTFVLGRTDETQGIYNKVPVVIFDDFTTATKFVDFPLSSLTEPIQMVSLQPRFSHLKNGKGVAQ